MAHKHLHELLKEAQEPFFPQNHIIHRTLFPVKNPHSCCFLDFPQSPTETPNPIFLKIQKRLSSSSMTIAKTQKKNNGFRLLGSLLRKLTHRNQTREIGGDEGVRVSVKDILSWDELSFGKISDETVSCSCNGRFSSGVWSLYFETSSSSNVSSGLRSPEFLSPPGSPKVELSETENRVEKDAEEKDRCSPVSVLDPPFAENDNPHDSNEDDNCFDHECSFPIVQRAKQQLLQKLLRFERLAELDPVELEKRMVEQDGNHDSDNSNNEQKEEQESDGEDFNDDWILKVVGTSNLHDQLIRIPEEPKRLISDLIREEETEQQKCNSREQVLKRVCKRVQALKEVKSNTIDMMVGQDFARELYGWKKTEDQVKEVALQIEIAIFGFLVEEFSEE